MCPHRHTYDRHARASQNFILAADIVAGAFHLLERILQEC